MSSFKLPVDPKELLPVAGGFALGLCILGFFALLASSLGLPLLVNHSNIPMQ